MKIFEEGTSNGNEKESCEEEKEKVTE